MNRNRGALTGNRTQSGARIESEMLADEVVPGRLLRERISGGRMAYLTRRELDVLALLAEGLSNKEIARALIITTHTVKAHITRILYKLGAESRTEAAVLWATRVEREA